MAVHRLCIAQRLQTKGPSTVFRAFCNVHESPGSSEPSRYSCHNPSSLLPNSLHRLFKLTQRLPETGISSSSFNLGQAIAANQYGISQPQITDDRHRIFPLDPTCSVGKIWYALMKRSSKDCLPGFKRTRNKRNDASRGPTNVLVSIGNHKIKSIWLVVGYKLRYDCIIGMKWG